MAALTCQRADVESQLLPEPPSERLYDRHELGHVNGKTAGPRPRIYQELWLSMLGLPLIAPRQRVSGMSSISFERTYRTALHLPVWVLPALGTMLLLLVVGERLLNDPDTWWHIAVGDWILAHDAFPRTDVFSFTMKDQPWTTTAPGSELILAGVYRLFGWSGVVALAAFCASLSVGLIVDFMAKRIPSTAAFAFGLVMLVLAMPHMVARPHLLAMPVMIAWAAGLIDAADRRAAPSFWLLPLMVLWSNLHGSFVLGLALTGVMAVDAIWNAPKSERIGLLRSWAGFGIVAVIAACASPYGWGSLVGAWRILTLGDALMMISEWRPMDFSRVTPFEIVMLAGFGLALLKGVTLPPLRILMLLGLLHLALSSVRHADVLACVAPLLLAAPLAPQFDRAHGHERGGVVPLAAAVLLSVSIVAVLAIQSYTPPLRVTPVAAVAALKQYRAQRPLNNYDFGGYMISAGLAPFIDGRTEVFGTTMMKQHDRALDGDARELMALIDRYGIDSTLLTPSTPAVAIFDRMDGWQRAFADDTAVVHVRKPAAAVKQPAARR